MGEQQKKISFKGGSPMQDHWTLRIHMTLPLKIPYRTTIFQALVLAFWRFQGIGMVEFIEGDTFCTTGEAG